ncbi:hypothetical protein ACFQ0M_23120 [Kitasatospora aburaviensis]
MDLALFRNPSFTGVMLCGLFYSAAAFSCLPYTSLWLQSVLGQGPLAAGLVMLPMSAVAFAVSAVAGRRLSTLPTAVPLGGGLAVIGIGGLLQCTLDGSSGWVALLPGLAVAGLGVGAVSPVLASSAMAAVPGNAGAWPAARSTPSANSARPSASRCSAWSCTTVCAAASPTPQPSRTPRPPPGS